MLNSARRLYAVISLPAPFRFGSLIVVQENHHDHFPCFVLP